VPTGLTPEAARLQDGLRGAGFTDIELLACGGAVHIVVPRPRAWSRSRAAGGSTSARRAYSDRTSALALVVGTIGGIYGIGGGSLLAPMLVALGRRGRAYGPRLDLPHLDRRRRHLRGPQYPPRRLDRAGLGRRPRDGSRRPARWLRWRRRAVASARGGPPSRARPARPGPGRPLRGSRG
jgi:hypothetical protein